MRNQLPLLRLAKIFTLVIVLICLETACYPQTTPGTSAQDAFLYIVNVQAKDTGQNIVRAEVSIQVAGQIPLNTITDDKGIASILIGASFINQPGLLIVEATPYKKYTRNITLFKAASPTVILLESESNPITPSPPTNVITETPTNTITLIPTKEATTTPTNTPTSVPPTSTPTVTPSTEPTSTPTITVNLTVFDYELRVEAKSTGHIVVNANIKIELEGKVVLDDKTDLNGLAKISIDTSQISQPIFLIVEAAGYKSYRQVIENTDSLPSIIQLETETLRPSDTPVATPTNTSTPVPTPPPPPPLVHSGKLVIPLKAGGGESLVQVIQVDTQGSIVNTSTIVNAKQPLFSPDGQFILTVGVVGNCTGLCRFDRNGQVPLRLNERASAHRPVWSPDGSKIIFADLGLSNGKILRQSSQGAYAGPDFTEIRANNITLVGRNLIWTEDNRLIFRECAYWLGQSGTCGIWVTDADTPNPQRILPTLDFPMDAKNGSLVYLSNADGDWDLYLIPLAGGSPTNLTDNGVNLQDGLATFSPDGRTIAYVSNESGVWAVWTVSLSNFEKRQWFAIDPQFGTIDLNTWAEDRMSWSQ